jgi:GH43 family beta-xylosidase
MREHDYWPSITHTTSTLVLAMLLTNRSGTMYAYNVAVARVLARSLTRVAGVIGVVGCVGCHQAPATGFVPDQIVNPLVRQRADPMVMRTTEGTYYMAATVPEYDRIELRTASSIAALGSAKPVTVWRKHATGEMGAHIWAPELHRIYGKWYIYFAAGRADSVWNIRMYVLENASPDPLKGEWIEKGQIHTGLESFSLDATTFAHHGKRYLVWAQKDTSLRNNSSIFIAEMSNPWTITGAPVRLSKPELPWEIIGYRVNEGPAVLIKSGNVFLTYSASATDANYCMGMLTASDASDLLDPRSWVKSQQPVFATSVANGQFGPGHNSFTVDAHGNDVLIYHARNYRDIKGDPLNDANRHTRAQYIRWTDDGLPDFGVPVPDGAAPGPP